MRSFTLFLLLSGMNVYLGIYGVSGPDSTTSDPCSRAIVGKWPVLATKHVIILYLDPTGTPTLSIVTFLSVCKDISTIHHR